MNVRLVGVSYEELLSALRFSGLYAVTDGNEVLIKAIPEYLQNELVRSMDALKQNLENSRKLEE